MQGAVAESTPADVIHVSAFDLPLSRFLSTESRAALQRQDQEFEELIKTCSFDRSGPQSVIAGRHCWDTHYYGNLVARHRARYGVAIRSETVAGVPTEIITPLEGVSLENQRRVLINLHGGAFVQGGRWGGEVESIPIAAVGKFKVMSVDYRMAPEHKFPSASEDVAAIYRELLKTYKPRNIGIYGCSAGGLLTAQAVSWLQKHALPRPGAVGMFCAAGNYYGEGDSGHVIAAVFGTPLERYSDPSMDLYLKDAVATDPLAFPARSEEVLSKFPPAMLITSTRDQSLSSVVYMHSRLVALGVDAELHVWEGLRHAFFLDPGLPQSAEVYKVIAHFFSGHLGQ